MANKKTVKRTVKVKPKSSKPVSGPKKELMDLLPDLSTEEIAWLVTQARTMIYNHKVEEVNAAAKNLVEAKKKTPPKKAPKKGAAKKPAVDIVQAENGKTFNIVVDNARLFLNLGELKALVKIAQADGDAGNGAGRLYRWMDRERRDMIIDGNLAGPTDPRLAMIHGLLREKFTVG